MTESPSSDQARYIGKVASDAIWKTPRKISEVEAGCYDQRQQQWNDEYLEAVGRKILDAITAAEAQVAELSPR